MSRFLKIFMTTRVLRKIRDIVKREKDYRKKLYQGVRCSIMIFCKLRRRFTRKGGLHMVYFNKVRHTNTFMGHLLARGAELRAKEFITSVLTEKFMIEKLVSKGRRCHNIIEML